MPTEWTAVGVPIDSVGRAGGTVLVARRPGPSALEVRRGDALEFVLDPAGVVVLHD